VDDAQHRAAGLDAGDGGMPGTAGLDADRGQVQRPGLRRPGGAAGQRRGVVRGDRGPDLRPRGVGAAGPGGAAGRAAGAVPGSAMVRGYPAAVPDTVVLHPGAPVLHPGPVGGTAAAAGGAAAAVAGFGGPGHSGPWSIPPK
jgi:hypothetical protein